MKFPTNNGIREVWSDQLSAKKCYFQKLKVATRPNEALSLEVPDLRDKNKLKINEPIEKLVPINIEEGSPEKIVFIGEHLQTLYRERLVQFLIDNADIFAWGVENMPGIDPEVIVHCLSVDPHAKPIKQKKH